MERRPGLWRALGFVVLALLVTVSAIGTTAIVTQPLPTVEASNVIQLTSGSSEHIGPAYSPSGKFIAFSSNRSGTYDVWVTREDGRKQTRLTWLPGDEVTPDWSPNGNVIAFVWNHGPYSDLCLTSFDTSGTKCLTDGMHVRSYSWSPSGLLMAYDSGDGTIWLHNITNGFDTAFSFGGFVRDPAFGPDPGTLYFSFRTNTGDYIWNASIDGSNSRQLSWEGSDVRSQVSPTGNYLMYLTNISGHYEPWLINLHTGINAYLFNRPDLGGAYTFPDPPLLASETVPCWGPNGTSVLMVSDGSASQGGIYLVTLDFQVDLVNQAVNPVQATTLPRNVFVLNVYNRVPVGEFARDAHWSRSGNIVVQANMSGHEQLIVLQKGPPVKVGYGG